MPNGNSENSEFSIYTNDCVERINALQIYSRWGELIFQASDFEPNDTRGSWDGTFNGQNLDPGVFVYTAEILFNDGKLERVVGDVTLLK